MRDELCYMSVKKFILHVSFAFELKCKDKKISCILYFCIDVTYRSFEISLARDAAIFFELWLMTKRPVEITEQFIAILDQHVLELKNGVAERVYHLKDIAALMYIHPRHLSNTISDTLSRSPCDLFEERLLSVAKEMILKTDHSIAHIARHLTYDPSNLSKFFKAFEGITPKQFRDQHR